MTVHAKRISVLTLGLVFTASVILGVTSIGRAQQTNPTGGSGLSISPTRTELRIERGKSDQVKVSIRNVTKGAIVAKPFVADFESDNETGEPKLLTDQKNHNSASIFNFVKGLSDVPLAPGESKDLTYTVNIPNDATAGAYYGAITYRAVPANQATTENGGGEVALTANVASLVLVEVPGEITEKIQITSIKALANGKGGSVFAHAPTKAAITIKNLGNSFAKPFGTVTVTNMSGKQIYSYEINNVTPRSNILPKTGRTFTDDIKNINKPGRYTITANVSFGSGGDVISQKSSFWYIPTWLMVILAVLVVGVVGGTYLLYRKQYGSHSAKKKR
jgi:hypothetical protein